MCPGNRTLLAEIPNRTTRQLKVAAHWAPTSPLDAVAIERLPT
jgi:hypothetical protein